MMKKEAFFLCLVLVSFIATPAAVAHDDLKKHPFCPFCEMDRNQYAQSRMLIEYADNETVGTCSIHCTASEISVHREKTLRTIRVADYFTRKLVLAENAFWVIGGNKEGVMTRRAKWAFENSTDAERFISENGGRHGTYREAMEITFGDMYGDIKMIQERRSANQMKKMDLKTFPECKYCGMNRTKYAHSRALIEYEEGTAVGTCSVHCLAIDLALNTDKLPKAIMVGDYVSKKLIDAERAFWVLGGDKMGVMSIRGKWAFEQKEEAFNFIRGNGGQISHFDEVMKASFKDMYEILK
jgi:copper chaperone NosL